MQLQLTSVYRIKLADGILISGVLISADTVKDWGELEVEFLGRTWTTSVKLSELLYGGCNIGPQSAMPSSPARVEAQSRDAAKSCVEIEIERLQESMSPEVKAEFGPIDRVVLRKAMYRCNMDRLPEPNGVDERAAGDCICDVCGNAYLHHPLDWRLIGYGDVPFVHVLCDGSRVKL